MNPQVLLSFYVEVNSNRSAVPHIRADINETMPQYDGLNLLGLCVQNQLTRLVPIFISMHVNTEKIMQIAIGNGDDKTIAVILSILTGNTNVDGAGLARSMG